MLNELVNWATGEMQRIEAEYAQGMHERRVARNAAARQRYARRKAKGALPSRKKVVRECVEYDKGCTCHMGNPPCRRCESGADAT